MIRLEILIGIPAIVVFAGAGIAAPDPSRLQAMRAAVHPVKDQATLQAWLSRVPVTHDFPDDLAATLRAQHDSWIVEMTSAPDCLPCGDLWARLTRLGRTYGWQVRTIGLQEAMVRSGKLGLPWVGHPVAWARSAANPDHYIPVAIGTDHDANLSRNLYLAAKMLAGVRPAVGVRAMSKYTGIVGVQGLPSVQRATK